MAQAGEQITFVNCWNWRKQIRRTVWNSIKFCWNGNGKSDATSRFYTQLRILHISKFKRMCVCVCLSSVSGSIFCFFPHASFLNYVFKLWQKNTCSFEIVRRQHKTSMKTKSFGHFSCAALILQNPISHWTFALGHVQTKCISISV